CGPTVYDFAHIGNWRTFVFADLVRRYLEFKGYTVTHVMNVTDVEDKIIKGIRLSRQSEATADETKTTLREFTGRYEAAFLEDLKTLNCILPHQMPHATEHIAEIISLIERLVARGIAYQATDGSVYFSIEKYRGCGCTYGRLLKLNFDELRPSERVKSDEYAKESLADFALWKARTPDDGDVFWPSPFGEGRPGWHIECSAMSMKILGPTFDLHVGGEDLIFPHHEDEIAQSEGATGKPFVKYWLHGAFLLVEGKKMSKSLGNFFTLRDLLAKGFTGREIRYLLLTAHYRETFNFTLEGLQGARAALARIEECLNKLLEFWDGHPGPIEVPPDSRDIKLLERFEKALDDDLNISQAWGVIFEWIRDLNRSLSLNKMSSNQAASALATWKKLETALGLNLNLKSALRMREVRGVAPSGFLAEVIGDDDAPIEIRSLLMQRMQARAEKDFKRSDAIRDELKAKGWAIEDTPKGPKLKRI
ncbi:MAG: cysteine--tRNA ligase, partial [Limisphaerales bacterium]